MNVKTQALKILVAAGLVLALAGGAAAANAIFARPALIASVGQSSDAAIVKVLLNTKLKMNLEYKPLAQPADVANFKTLILVVGASTKGLGAAGIDLEQEQSRAKALLAAAKEKGVKVLVMHTGGESRRGKSSNDLVEIVMPGADAAVVVKTGNKDRLFNQLAAKRSIPLLEVEKVNDAGPAVKGLFQE